MSSTVVVVVKICALLAALRIIPSLNPFAVRSLLGCACQTHMAGATFDISLATVELWMMSPKFPLAYAPKSKRHPLTSSTTAGKERGGGEEEIEVTEARTAIKQASIHLPESIGYPKRTGNSPTTSRKRLDSASVGLDLLQETRSAHRDTGRPHHTRLEPAEVFRKSGKSARFSRHLRPGPTQKCRLDETVNTRRRRGRGRKHDHADSYSR